MVYAVAGRAPTSCDVGDDLLAVEDELAQAMDYSRERAAEVVESARPYRFGRSCLTRYFRVLHLALREEYRAGLQRFYELAHEAGELPKYRRATIDEFASGGGCNHMSGGEASVSAQIWRAGSLRRSPER